MNIDAANYMQILIAIVVALGFLNTGSSLTFPSIVSADSDSNATNFYGQPFFLTSTEKDMTGSLLGVGAVSGAVSISMISSIWGRRPAMFCNGLIGLMSWIAIALSPNIIGILIPRICSGIAVGGVSVVGMNYVSETADGSTRGLLCSLNSSFLAIGSLWTIFLGYWFKYYTVSFINSMFAIGLTFGLAFLPESPKFLSIKGNIEGAKSSLRRIRSVDEEQINREIEFNIESNKGKKDFREIWKELLRFKVTKRVFVVAALFMIRSFGGNEILTINSTRIFYMLGSNGNEELFSIVLFVLVITGSLGSSFFLIDRIGRKKCMYLSLSLGLLGVGSLTVCSYLSEAEHEAYDQLTKSGNYNIMSPSNDTDVIISIISELDSGDEILDALMEPEDKDYMNYNQSQEVVYDTVNKELSFNVLNLHESTMKELRNQFNLSRIFIDLKDSKYENVPSTEFLYEVKNFNYTEKNSDITSMIYSEINETKSSNESILSPSYALAQVSKHENTNWTIILVSHISVMVAVFGFSLGVQAVPFVVNSEYFPTWLRAQTSSIGIVSFMLSQFIALQSFSPMVKVLGLSGYFLCSTVVLLLCFPFIRYGLEETMGKEIG